MSKPNRAQRHSQSGSRTPSAESEASDTTAADDALRDAERRYRDIFENAALGIYQSTPEGRYLDVNPALARIYGYASPEELMATVTDIARELYVDPGRRDEFVRAIEGSDTLENFESEVYRRDRSKIWICEHGRAVRDDEGRVVRYEGLVEDITPRKEAEEALRESEERYALAVRAANDGLWDWNVITGRVYYSPRWKEMIGVDEDELGDRIEDWLQRIHPDDQPRVKAELESHLEGQDSHFESEFRIRHSDGSYHWMLSRALAVYDEEGRAVRMAGSQADVTKRKVAEERLFHDAFHDSLTGLPNRALFTDRLGRSLWRARRREEYRFAVVVLDLDRVKLINDSLGHVAGDRLLLALARRIEECLRAGDSAARVGGDEFAVLIDDLSDPADAIRVVTRLQQSIREPMILGGQEVYTTASIGIAFHADRYERPEDMLRDADTAMYAAKAAGGSRYQVFDQGMHERAVQRLQIESSIRRAVERGELRAYYQPVVSLSTGRLRGFEALIRWEHPERGLILPADFIPIAEETGLIHKIGRWILREACDQLARWSRELRTPEPLSVSVNLSGRQLTESDLVMGTLRTLEDTGLYAEQLTLEITESAVMQDPDNARERLGELRSLGIGISIDDFGTGYSSLSYLHRLPLTALKIDRTFVSAMGENVREAQICHAIVTLAHNLGLTVIAEGIETKEQRTQLRELHCEYGQGFHFAVPLTAEAATELVRSGCTW
jgi:diguanylate cyclase (GGDEF)-like protein/PAS domain S-box-containing protein